MTYNIKQSPDGRWGVYHGTSLMMSYPTYTFAFIVIQVISAVQEHKRDYNPICNHTPRKYMSNQLDYTHKYVGDHNIEVYYGRQLINSFNYK